MKRWRRHALSIEVKEVEAQGHCLNRLADVAAAQGCLRQALVYAERRVEACRAIGVLPVLGMALIQLGYMTAVCGRYAEAIAYGERALDILNTRSSDPGVAFARTHALAWLSLWSSLGGMDKEAEAYAVSALAGDIQLPPSHAYIRLYLADALSYRSHHPEARSSYDQALETFRQHNDLEAVYRALAGLAEVCLAQGQPAQAKVHADEALDLLDQYPHLWGVNYPILTLYRCYRVVAAIGDPRAQFVLERVYERVMLVAGQLKDEKMRNRFLQHVPYNREIVETWKRQHAHTEPDAN